MGFTDYLALPAAHHALLAATLVAIACGVIGPFVISRQLSFAVHGTAELSFTGAAAGLVLVGDALTGALVGSLVVGAAFGALSTRQRERDAGIGIILAFGLGAGIFTLGYYRGFATAATNILFGDILSVSVHQLVALVVVTVLVIGAILFLYRPLLFASVDPDVAEARGIRTRLLGLLFLLLLALTVTEAAQIVGTLLVLSLTITPAAAAQRLSARPARVMLLSVLFALLAADGGIFWLLLEPDAKASVLVTTVSFSTYALVRLATAVRGRLALR